LIQDFDKERERVINKGLNSLEAKNQIDWNTQRNREYLIQNEDRNTVYINCNPSGHFKKNGK